MERVEETEEDAHVIDDKNEERKEQPQIVWHLYILIILKINDEN